MICLGVSYRGITRPVTIEKGSINADRYIKEILRIAPEDGSKLLGHDFVFSAR